MAVANAGNYTIEFNGQRGLYEFKNTKGSTLPKDLQCAFTSKKLADQHLVEFTNKEIAKSGKRQSK